MSQKTTAPDAKWNPWLRPGRIRKKAGPRPEAPFREDPERTDLTRNILAFDDLPKDVRELLQRLQINPDCREMVAFLESKMITKQQLIAMLRRYTR